MFADEAKICLVSGRGGHGLMSFRREKHRPKGGPDGGDGGDGGDVVLRASSRVRTLAKFHDRIHWKAEKGQGGASNDRRGRRGRDAVVDVPVGTVVKQLHTQEILADLRRPGEQITLVRGGEGGRGNTRFKHATRQAPRIFERGQPGEELWVSLELKLLADVGLVGPPNAGKSTLLSTVSNQEPKVAAYPFTTLQPHLGVAAPAEDRDFVVVDIPGLIEGAHGGKGVGDRFLKHVERTRVLAHLVDVSGWEGRDPIADYRMIRRELEAFAPTLRDKPQIVVGTKVDLLDEDAQADVVERFAEVGVTLHLVSAAQQRGIAPFLDACDRLLHACDDAESAVETPDPDGASSAPDRRVYRPEPEDPPYRVVRDAEGFHLVGPAMERLGRLNLEEPDAVDYLHEQLERLNVFQALEREGAQEGDRVLLGEVEFAYQPE